MRQQFANGSAVRFDRKMDTLRIYITRPLGQKTLSGLEYRLLDPDTREELIIGLGLGERSGYRVDPVHPDYCQEYLQRQFAVAIVVPADNEDLRQWQVYFHVDRQHDTSLIPLLYMRAPTEKAAELFDHYRPTDCGTYELVEELEALIRLLDGTAETLEAID